MTAEHKKLLKEWQNRIGLSEWRIKLVDNCAPENMALQNCDGCTSWEESVKAALIEIIDPKYFQNRVFAFDWEVVLVHELLHLKFCLVSEGVGDLQERYMHQIIDDLARAFVDTKRS